MAKFYFRGEIPGSKSVFNRALIVQSYFPALALQGFSSCDDVVFMREGIRKISQQSYVHCGEGGTTFRFLSLRASREAGEHFLEGTPRLLQRPQKGLMDLLSQLGVKSELTSKALHIFSSGWQKPAAPLQVDTSESSQYASALILNAWNLNFDLEFELVGDKVSESYFLLTLQMLRDMGMVVHQNSRGYFIPAGQTLKKKEWRIESDLSSAFTMASAGALAGQSVLENFPTQSAQPDLVFLDIFKKMGVDFSVQGSTLTVNKTNPLRSLEWDLGQSPDLFPVLAVLCSYAAGTSRLFGAPHLTKKESNRIAKVSDLFRLAGISHEALPDGMIIHGSSNQTPAQGVFNPDKDHRMVMAATLLNLQGHQIQIEEPDAINKSFPEFWSMIGVKP
ncbi:3-phosphoshikimate 1-carboxyvinyltransferase [Bdellovibrio bacteriovorus]|uniref:3-phosphoshikimate 1-carboxyvinyltransferase n=1 Tax=Bdellovibrio bacteriovorus TaxID=959 RepID=UPI0035A6437D